MIIWTQITIRIRNRFNINLIDFVYQIAVSLIENVGYVISEVDLVLGSDRFGGSPANVLMDEWYWREWIASDREILMEYCKYC